MKRAAREHFSAQQIRKSAIRQIENLAIRLELSRAYLHGLLAL